MTDEKILDLAEQADLITSAGIVHYAYADRLERFAALVRRDAFKQVDDLLRARWFNTQEDAQEAIRALAAQEES